MLITILVTTIYALINLILGFGILKYILKQQVYDKSVLVILVTSFLLGEGILSAMWLFLGLIGYFKIAIIVAIIMLIIVWGIFLFSDLERAFKSLWLIFLSEVTKLSFFWKTVLLIATVLIVAIGLKSLLLPPTGDAESFYMVLSKIMAGVGRFLPQPNYYEFSKLSVFGEMHYAALMVLNSFAAAKLFVWFNALCAVGLLIILGTYSGLKSIGKVILLVLLLTSPVFTNFIFDGKVDIFGAVLGLASYYWVLQIKNKNWLAIVLTGLFFGFAIAAKLSNALVITPGLIAIIIWDGYSNWIGKKLNIFVGIKDVLVKIIYIILFAGLAYMPQLVKNAIVFHDPWASRYSVEQSQSWVSTPWTLSVDNIPVDAKKSRQRLVNIIISPSLLEKFKNYTPNNINQIRDWPILEKAFYLISTAPFSFTVWDYPGKGGNLSILVLAFLPLLFFIRSMNISQKQILGMVLMGICVWVLFRSTATTPRYIMATLLLFLPLIAGAVEEFLERKHIFINFLIVVSILFMLCTTLAVNSSIFSKTVKILTKHMKVEDLYGPYYKSFNFLNNQAMNYDRTFLVGYNAFYLKSGLLTTLDNNQEKLEFLFLIQDQPWVYLYNHGFKYVVIQKQVNFLVINQLEHDPKPDNLEIQKIYSDSVTDIFSINQKINNP